MAVYFLFLLFLTLLALVFDFHSLGKREARSGVFLAGVFLIVIAGFRYHCGPDFGSYYYIFTHLKQRGPSFEFGFVFLNKLFNEIGAFRIMLLCVAIVSITLKMLFFYKESRFPFLSIALYFMGTFLAQDFGQIRQGLALSFSLFAFNEAYKRRLVRFLLLFFMAFSFHYTAIVILPFYWFGRITLTKGRSIFLLLASCAASVFFLTLVQYLVALLNIPYLNSQFALYNSMRFGFETVNFISLLITHIPIVVLYFIYQKRLLAQAKSRYFFQLFIWGVCMQIAFFSIPEIALRGTAYFEIMDTILLPNIAKIVKANERFIFCVVLIALILFKFYLNNREMPEFFLPYQINFNLLEN